MGQSVNSIDISNFSRMAWSTMDKFTGLSWHSSRLCPVSANSVVSQLVKNEAQKRWTSSPSGSSTRRCPIFWKVRTSERDIYVIPSRLRILLPPSNIWSHENRWVSILLSWSLYTTPDQIFVMRFSLILHAPTQKFQDLESGENFCACKVSKSNKEMFCSFLHSTALLMFCFTCFHANQ